MYLRVTTNDNLHDLWLASIRDSGYMLMSEHADGLETKRIMLVDVVD
jgi:hypothetical protein